MKRTKRLLCLLLAFVFVAALLPAAAYAAPPDEACRSPQAQANGGRHYWVIDHVDQPGCTTEGTQYWVCEYCGRTWSEALPALGHNWTEEEPAPGCSPATCTEGTTMIRICGDCGAQETFEQSALGHDWETVTTEPKGLIDGSVVSTCRRCGETRTELLSAATSIFNLVRHVPPEAEDADALVIVTQPEGGLISYGGGDSRTLTVKASGGVPDYHYEWHRVDDFLDRHSTMSVISSAAVEKFRGTQESYQSQSSSFASAFQSAAKGLGLGPGQSLKKDETSEQPAYIPLGDAVLGEDSPSCAVTSAGRYYCVVTDEAGNKATSEEAAVNYHLYISQQPLSRNIRGLDSVTLSCVAVGCGEGNVLYSLRGQDGNYIATGLQTGAYDVSEPGEYQFSVDDLVSGESLDSNVVTVYDAAPLVIENPQQELIREPEDAPADIEMTISGGVPPYSCVWTFDDGTQELPSTETVTLSEPGSVIYTVDKLGLYILTVTDAMEQSCAETVTVKRMPLTIDKQPVGGMLPKGEGASQLFIAMADGEEPFTYTLYRNGEVCDMTMDGATHSVYVSQSGEYSYHIEDNTGRWVDSDRVVVEDYHLSIEKVKVSGSFDNKDSFPTMTAVVKGGQGEISFQWWYNGLDGSAEEQLTYKAENARAKRPGLYTCIATDESGASAVKQGIEVSYDGTKPCIVIQPQDQLLDYRKDGSYSTVLYCQAVSSDGESALRYDWEFRFLGKWYYLYTGRTLPWEGTGSATLRCVVTNTRTGEKTSSEVAKVVIDVLRLDDFYFEKNELDSETTTFYYYFSGGKAPYRVKIYSQYRQANKTYKQLYSSKTYMSISPLTFSAPAAKTMTETSYDGGTFPVSYALSYYVVVSDATGQQLVTNPLMVVK